MMHTHTVVVATVFHNLSQCEHLCVRVSEKCKTTQHQNVGHNTACGSNMPVHLQVDSQGGSMACKYA